MWFQVSSVQVQELVPILREGLVVSDDERRGGSDHGDHNQPLTSQLFLLVQFLNQKKTVALGAVPPHTSHRGHLPRNYMDPHFLTHPSADLCKIRQYFYFQQFLRKGSASLCVCTCWQSKGL